MEQDNSSKSSRPYAGFGTFLTTLDHYGAVGIPNVVDRNTLPPSLSGSSRYEILGALRFFGLVDDAGKPNTALLTRLINSDTRRDTLVELLKEHYAGLFALPLATAGPGEVKKWFSENSTPSTADRARAFFLSAAKQTGIQLHAMVAKGTRSVTGSVKRKRRKVAKIADGDEGAAAVNGEVDDEPAGGTTRTVALRQGSGTLAVRVSVDLWDLEGDDRAFVFAVMDALKSYDRGDDVALLVSKKGASSLPGAAE